MIDNRLRAIQILDFRPRPYDDYSRDGKERIDRLAEALDAAEARGRAGLVARIEALAENLGAPIEGLGLRSSDGSPMAPLYGGEDVAYRLRQLVTLDVSDQE